MEFNSQQPIYLQIAEMICERILNNHFQEEERIPSVREMAVQLEVNPNTVMRTFEYLQTQGIITNKRGIGYFVAGDGKQQAHTLLKQEFFNNELLRVFKTLSLLNISFAELQEKFNQYQSDNKL